MDQKQVKEFLTALDSIIKEKGIEKEVVIEAMEQAMVAAFKKKTGNPNGRCKVNEDTGEIKLYSFKTVVEEVNDDRLEISLEDAKKIVPDIEIGETIEKEEELKDFSRVAAGTAKQVVVQRVKEAEKKIVSDAFSDKKDEMLVGILSREDAKNYYVDLGKAHGVLPKNEIIPGEKLEMGSSIKVYVSKIEMGSKGIFILLTRKHFNFLKRLLESEIPELSDGSVILYSVAREAGSRSKIAVYSDYNNIDPVGAVIGPNGIRLKNILNQLGNEKIDIIRYDKDPVKFITNALSPAKDVRVFITDEKSKEAIAVATGDNLSLAIGKKGQNVRLASQLTHYKIEVTNSDDVNVGISD